MTCLDAIKLSTEIIVAGAALTGAIVAVKGLGTWKSQLKGQSEYELARRILVSLFRFRDAINGVRHPMMWAYEMPSPPEEEARAMNREQLNFYGTSKAFQARWDKVNSEKTTLYADLLEAEAIWGNELKTLFTKIFSLERELMLAIRNYLELINPEVSAEHKDAIRRITKEKRDVMYDDLSEEGDEFRNDLVAAIEEIEKYLKPKLGHKKCSTKQ